MPYVERRGEPALFYELDDYTDPWKRAPFLFLAHGFARSSRFWYSWVPYLSRFYKVVRPDLRGQGRSSAQFDFNSGLSLELYLEDVNAIIDHLGADSVHYCGESLGGIIGVAFAAEYPDRVRTLSLVSAPVYISEHNKKNTTYGYSSRIEALQKMGARAWAEASNGGRRFPPDADPELLRWTADEMGKSDVNLLIAGQRWVSDLTVEPYLPRIQAPVLGLYPSAGPIAGDEQIDILKSRVADIRIVRMPTRYHSIQNFMPAACATEVLHFAAQHDGIPCRES
jgi:3-oxoadipate enol-lactonase